MVDLTLTIVNKSLQNFMSTFDLECLIKKSTCFQFSDPRCLDLILRNFLRLHSLIVTALKSQLLKGNTTAKLYRDYSSFNIDHFKEDLGNNLKNNSITEYFYFQKNFLEIIHEHALIKKKKDLRIKGNPFMTKALRKPIMHRSKFNFFFS